MVFEIIAYLAIGYAFGNMYGLLNIWKPKIVNALVIMVLGFSLGVVYTVGVQTDASILAGLNASTLAIGVGSFLGTWQGCYIGDEVLGL